MLIQLLPDQISKFWDVIKYALESSPPLPNKTNRDDWINRILSSCLSGKLDVWVSYTKGDRNKVEGIVMTSIAIDNLMYAKELLIYYIYSYDTVDRASWMDGLITITKYAINKGCDRIVAYSDNDNVIGIVKKLGGSTNVRYISFDPKIVLKSNDLIGGQSESNN